MPSEKHQAVISKLSELGTSTHGFKRSVIEAIRLEEGQEVAECLKEDVNNNRVTPDAFRIEVHKRTVIAFEVEMFNAIDESKMARYVDWWWMLDDFYWDLRLVGVKCIANVGICYEIDLKAFIYAILKPKPVCTLSISATNCSDVLRQEDDAPSASPPSSESFS